MTRLYRLISVEKKKWLIDTINQSIVIASYSFERVCGWRWHSRNDAEYRKRAALILLFEKCGIVNLRFYLIIHNDSITVTLINYLNNVENSHFFFNGITNLSIFCTRLNLNRYWLSVWGRKMRRNNMIRRWSMVSWRRGFYVKCNSEKNF